MATTNTQVLTEMYAKFNERNIDAVLAQMQPDVDWPNGWEGGYLKGTNEVRKYWQRQWKELDPRVMPLSVNEAEDGLVKVKVHQVVKDMQGKLLSDAVIKHTYRFENGLIKNMEIGED